MSSTDKVFAQSDGTEVIFPKTTIDDLMVDIRTEINVCMSSVANDPSAEARLVNVNIASAGS